MQGVTTLLNSTNVGKKVHLNNTIPTITPANLDPSHAGSGAHSGSGPINSPPLPVPVCCTRCFDCIPLMEYNQPRTRAMDWVKREVELMPAAVCSLCHSVCVCVLITVTAAVHDCPLQTRPSHCKPETWGRKCSQVIFRACCSVTF